MKKSVPAAPEIGPEPWTAQKLQTVLGIKLTEKIGTRGLNDIAENLDRLTRIIRTSDEARRRRRFNDLPKMLKAFQEARHYLSGFIAHIEQEDGEQPADHVRLLAELDRLFPEGADKSKGGRPGSIAKVGASDYATWVRITLNEAQIKLSIRDRTTVITRITAAWTDDDYPEGAEQDTPRAVTQGLKEAALEQ